MKVLKVLHNGPRLSNEDIKPYITKNSKTCIYSVVDGTKGILKITSSGFLISKNGTKMPSVTFERGPEVMIVSDGECPFVISKVSFDKIQQAKAQSF